MARVVRIRKEREKKVENTLSAKDWEDCLKYFDYKDAYTGNALYDTTIDHIIPLSKGGGKVRQNIIPCNRSVNSSKFNNDFLPWYKKQIFFNNTRLRKIFKWMGNYRSFLYAPIETISDPDRQNKTIQKFKFITPDNKYHYIYYSSSANKQKLSLLLKTNLLNKWEDYLNDHWLWFSKFDNNKLNYEDKVKSFLDRCATFLIKGSLKKFSINTKDKEHKTYKNEVLMCDLDNGMNEILYSSADNNIIMPSANFKTLDDIHKEDLEECQYITDKEDLTKWEQKRIKKIYDKKGTLRNLKLKNVIKNTFYIAKWCLVDTENTFKFNGNIYKIDNTCEQYNVTIRKYDDYRQKKEVREDYDMFEIFAYIPCRKEYIPKKLNNSKKEVIVNCPTLVQNAPVEFYDHDINNISEFVVQL